MSLQQAADSSECTDSLQSHRSLSVYNDTLFGELPISSTRAVLVTVNGADHSGKIALPENVIDTVSCMGQLHIVSENNHLLPVHKN